MTTAQQPRPAPNSALQNLGLAALGAFLGVGVIVWATGQLAARLTTGEWPKMAFSEIPPVLGRLPHHLSDPALAWPPRAARLLPGPVGFYLTLVLVLAPVVAVGWLALRLHTKSGHNAKATSGVARWASAPDLRGLIVSGPEPGRVIVGRHSGKLIAAAKRCSVLVVGPTQTGKTSGFAIPALLEWDGPIIATSIKDDLVRDTIDHRSSIGRVFVLDPTAGTGIPRATWSPLAGCETWQGAIERARLLMTSTHQTAGPASGVDQVNERFEGWAERYLAALLRAAVLTGASTGQVISWIDYNNHDDPDKVLEAHGEQGARDAIFATQRMNARMRDPIIFNATAALRPFQEPVVAAMEGNQLTPDAFLDGGANTLYLCAAVHHQERLAPLLATVLSEIVRAVYERSASGKPVKRPLLLLLDEVANIAPVKDLHEIASGGAGQGIQLVTICQDLAQLTRVYGQATTNTITSNHLAKLFLTSISDPQTLAYAGDVLGEQATRHQSHTTDRHGIPSVTESVTYRTLAPPNLLRELEPGHAILICQHYPAVKVALRPWFNDAQLRHLGRSGRPLHSSGIPM